MFFTFTTRPHLRFQCRQIGCSHSKLEAVGPGTNPDSNRLCSCRLKLCANESDNLLESSCEVMRERLPHCNCISNHDCFSGVVHPKCLQNRQKQILAGQSSQFPCAYKYLSEHCGVQPPCIRVSKRRMIAGQQMNLVRKQKMRPMSEFVF